MEIFVLHHVHIFDDGEEDVKLIGLYILARAGAGGARASAQCRDFVMLPKDFPSIRTSWTKIIGRKVISP